MWWFLFCPLRTPCKINPTVTTVLATHKPCKEETPLKRLQDHHQQQQEADSGKAQEQSMYCKELLLLSGATEFSFEELRAERHFKKVAQEAGGQKDKSSAATSNWCLLLRPSLVCEYFHCRKVCCHPVVNIMAIVIVCFGFLVVLTA